MKGFIYRHLLEPRSNNPESHRKELVLNTMLLGLFIAGCLILLIIGLDMFIDQAFYERSSLVEVGIFLLVICMCWWLSRAGHHHLICYMLPASVGGLAICLTLQWSFELPLAELTYGLMVVVSGIILTARHALVFSGLAVTLLAVIGWQQASHRLNPKTDWLDQSPILSDAFGYAAIFGAMGLASWLANREIAYAAQQAHLSEAALLSTKRSMEVELERRLKEMEIAQMSHTKELQRFAEFGRINANLLHDIASPITAAMLNLDNFDGRKLRLIAQARYNLTQLEKYLNAARQQLQNQGSLTSFSIKHQLMQVKRLIAPTAKQRGVAINLVIDGSPKLYGDPIKFSRLMANLILNAIDAYPDDFKKPPERQIRVEVLNINGWSVVKVIDYGKGISANQLPNLFEPFYTTKTGHRRGLGIGLAIVKQYVENDFHGNIQVQSSSDKGTQFIVRLRSPQVR